MIATETCSIHHRPLDFDVVTVEGKKLNSVCDLCAELPLGPGLKIQGRLFNADKEQLELAAPGPRTDQRQQAGKTILYVAGFLFDEAREHVVLLEKQKPLWMKGKLNGVGGKIEDGETPIVAMRREFEEETGLALNQDLWHEFCELKAYNGAPDLRCVVHFYRAFAPIEALRSCRTAEEGQPVAVYQLDKLPRQDPGKGGFGMLRTMNNLPWLIAMALGIDEERVDKFEVTER